MAQRAPAQVHPKEGCDRSHESENLRAAVSVRSDVPSVAEAYIQDRIVAWTEVYGDQSLTDS